MDADIESLLETDPGNPLFSEYANVLRVRGEYDKGLRVCFAGLSANPACQRGRLVLARLFFELGFLPFAVREVRELCNELPQNETLRRLLQKLAPDEAGKANEAESEQRDGQRGEETVAEAELAFDDIDLISDGREE